MIAEKTLIMSMVDRLEAELPYNKINSRMKFEQVKYIDIFVIQAGAKTSSMPSILPCTKERSLDEIVETLVKLSIYRLSTVIEAVVGALERIPINKNHPALAFNDETAPTDTLNSQYYLICLLSACLQQWREKNPNDLRDHPEVSTQCRRAYGHCLTNPSANQKSGVMLDDKVAHRVLAVISPFLRQPPRIATAINREIDHRSLLLGLRANKDESIFTETFNCMRISEHYTAETLLLTRLFVIAGRVAFFISIGNWCVTYNRIKSRLEALAYKPSTADEMPQIGEVQLMECAALNKERLGKVLDVLHTTIQTMKQPIQNYISLIAYRAIWGWIQAFDEEFIQLYKEKGQIHESINILFTLCQGNSMKKGKEVLWPFQTALLLISPGVLEQSVEYDENQQISNSPHPSILEFVRTIKKMATGGEKCGEEMASICVLDICRAASCLDKEKGLSVLHRLVVTAKNDIQDRLFDINQPLVIDRVFISCNEQNSSSSGQEQRGGTLVDIHCLLMSALATLYRLNPRNAVYSVFPMCFDNQSPVLYKSALARALRSLITFYNDGAHDDMPPPWQLGSDHFYDTMCEPIRQIFIKYVNSVSGYSDCSMKKGHSRNCSSNTMTPADRPKNETRSISSQAACLDINEKFHAIWEILSLYVSDPKLIIMGRRKDTKSEERVLILEALIQCLRFSSKSIIFLATECMRKLHTSAYIPYWGYPKHTMAFFWKMSSTMIKYFSKELLILRSFQTTETLSCMGTIIQILIERVKYIKSVDQKNILEEWDATDYLQGAITLHVAGLIWLNAPNEDILLANFLIIKEFCKEIEHLFVNNRYTDTIGFQAFRALLENYPVYRELSKINRERVQGRKRAQKQIWRFIRMFPHDSPASLVAWREVWKRWRVLTEVLTGIPAQTIPSRSEPSRSPSSSRSFGSSSSSATSPASSTAGGGHFQTGASFDTQDHNNERGASKKRYYRSTWNYNERYVLWNNCTGFLASLAGVCLGRKPRNDLRDKNDEINSDYDNDEYNAMLSSEETEQQATDFIRVLVQLLSCNDVFIREKITDILSKELSPAVQTLLLEQLEHALSTYGVSTSMKFNCFMLVEQTSIILSSYLENLANEPTTSAAVSSQIFTNLVDQCATFLLCKPADANKSTLGTDITRIRLRFAHLCESLMTTKNTTSWIMIQKEFVLRTKLLTTIIEWTSGFQPTQPSQQQIEQAESPTTERNKATTFTGPGTSTTSDNTAYSPSTTPVPVSALTPITLKDSNIHRDLEVTCIRAMTLLLEGLPLQPNTFGSFMGTEENYMQVKSHMFNRYFTYFHQVLQECVTLLSDPGKAYPKQQTTTNVGDLNSARQTPFTSTTSPHSGYSMNSAHSPRYLMSSSEEGSIQRALDIKSYAIEAIANLVHANLDVGLSQVLNMSYDNNMSVRCAYTQIITSVLEKGAQFENLSATINIDRYRRLVDILTDESNNFGFAQLLCQCCQASKADITARCLLKCFASKKKTVKFLMIMIEKEIRSTDDEAEILRRTTITTRLLSYFAEIIGATYIQQTLHPVFNKLSKKALPEGTSYEVNPLRVDDKNICQNTENVSEAADMILTAICNSADKAPRAILQLCHCISICAESRFPEAKYKAVGAYLFLRFFCPAIVSPESTNFHGKISPVLYRGLLLAGKIAQNLANNVLFGDKEAYMIPLNDLLTRNIYRVTRFLREIAKDPKNNDYIEDIEEEFENNSMKSGDYNILHHVLTDNIQAMAQQLYKKNIPYPNHGGGKTVNQAILSEMILRGQYECVSNLLAHLGSPPDDVSRKKASDFSLRGRPLNFANQSYIDFMRQNSERYIDDILAKEIVYEAGRSRAGRPVLYFIFRRIQTHDTDLDSLTYMALRIMEVLSAEPFEVIADFTMYKADLNSSLDQKLFYRLAQLTPREIYNNIVTVHALNANLDVCRYLKRDLPKSVREFISKFHFVTSETDIYQYVHPKELHLPESDAELITEPLVTVTGHRQLANSNDKMIPVTIKLTHHYIQSITTKRQKLFTGCSAVLNDVFSIADIEEVTLGVANSEFSTHEVRFKYQKSLGTVIFHTSTSQDAGQFVFILRNLMTHVEAQPVSPITKKLIPPLSSIRPENVPGILLNMALINMGNQNEELRHTSYTMLSALSESFQFVLAGQFVGSKGVCIPKNDTFWVVGVSTKLAFTQPELTLELFREWFSGYRISDESNKRLCIEYITPWLSNIGKIYSGSIGDDQVVTKTKNILHMLIDITVKANETIRHILLCKIWKTIGNNNAESSMFIDLVLNTITEYASDHGGVGSIQTEIMADIVVSMFNMVVCTKILAKLHNIFLRTSFNWTHWLANHSAWRKSITILIRFMLMGSFHYRGPVKNCTPEVLHVISITAGIGTTLERETLHSMMVNFKQGLCVIESVNSEKGTVLLEKLDKFASVRIRLLFGLTKPYTTPYTATPETTTDVIESVDLYNVEKIIEYLVDCVETVAPNMDMLNSWKIRWLGLASSLAFQSNPAIQPRAFIVIGCLAREGVDDELLYQMLNALKAALANAHFEPVQGIIMCLRRVVCSIPPDSCYLLSLFWISLFLVQVDHRPLFSATLELLSGVIHTLQEHGMIGRGDNNLASVLFKVRCHGGLMQEYEQELGVRFDKYFSFGVATVLLKSAIHDLEMLNALKPVLVDFLTIEVNQYNTNKNEEEIANNVVPASALGYMAALLPCIASDEDVQRELGLVLSTDTIKKLCIPDKTSELLFITLLTIQLSSHDSQRKLRVYELLVEAANLMPDTFSMVYEIIVSKMNKILSNSTDLELTDRVNSIILTICSNNSVDIGDRSKRKLKAALENAGFSGLIDLHSPRKRDIITTASLASRLIAHIIDTSS